MGFTACAAYGNVLLHLTQETFKAMDHENLILKAQIIVQETLLCSILMQLGASLPGKQEAVRAIMVRVEDELIASQRQAPQQMRELAQASREYFNQFSLALLGNVTRGAKH